MTWAVAFDPRNLPGFLSGTGFPLEQLYNTVSGCWFAHALKYSAYSLYKK